MVAEQEPQLGGGKGKGMHKKEFVDQLMQNLLLGGGALTLPLTKRPTLIFLALHF